MRVTGLVIVLVLLAGLVGVGTVRTNHAVDSAGDVIRPGGAVASHAL